MKLKRKEVNLQPLRIIVSGGGTGGHIFPAIAIANAIKTLRPDTEFLFVGAEGKMEMEKVPAAGYKIEGLWISGFQRKFSMSNFAFPFKVISSLMKAKKIIRSFKPDAVIGTGGYASGPMLRVASNYGIPTLIQEQNSYAGVTNKILSKKVDRICVAYSGMEKFFPKEKIKLTGNPVRQDILSLEGKRDRGLEQFGLSGDKKIVLVIGGSQGARTINESILKCLETFEKNNIQLIWQTGTGFHETAKQAVSNYIGKGIKTFDFIQKMDYAYAVADMVISRAGASSVSELCLVKKPCIFIPLPTAAEDHQTKNAMALVTYNAAIIIKDSEAREKLCEQAINLIKDEEMCFKLSDNIAKLAMHDSAKVIANEVLSLINNRK
ncbi:MAG: undecaprenyldiphospho-muramoylpentapeptide beta-N-acetylglucosaminyltransferase [Bacteroidetes bacterium RIFCSPLOWO2_12_FULL_35_15]|nr:MAG: undecaprenyldiphospho-muramoylpentapeptide beta-N-acetylglucosaminyltransferase [Bacteroidetes bacterium RIFCSPLOWO2_12_FULL_35_15]